MRLYTCIPDLETTISPGATIDNSLFRFRCYPNLEDAIKSFCEYETRCMSIVENDVDYFEPFPTTVTFVEKIDIEKEIKTTPDDASITTFVNWLIGEGGSISVPFNPLTMSRLIDDKCKYVNLFLEQYKSFHDLYKIRGRGISITVEYDKPFININGNMSNLCCRLDENELHD